MTWRRGPPFNLYWVSHCYRQRCLRVRVYVRGRARPTHVDGAKHKHMCVAMAPTTAVTPKPICCVTVVMVISQREGERATERGGIQRKRWRGWDIVLLECSALFPLYRKPLHLCVPQMWPHPPSIISSELSVSRGIGHIQLGFNTGACKRHLRSAVLLQFKLTATNKLIALWQKNANSTRLHAVLRYFLPHTRQKNIQTRTTTL